MPLPIVGITAGDPNGVGPEIVLKALCLHSEIYQKCRPVVYADPAVLRFYADRFQMKTNIKPFRFGADLSFGTSEIYCAQVQPFSVIPNPGNLRAEAGVHAAACISRAIEDASKKQLQAVATAPINKEALRAGSVPYLDHTQMFSEQTNSSNTMTLFATGKMRIFFHTRHLAFKDISAALHVTEIAETLERCIRYLEKIGIKDPHVALAALNPHGGEQGMFGTEEIEILSPAVHQSKKKGLRVSGPVPADSVFHLNLQGMFDAVLSLYHYQGHIAAKTYDFYGTVSLTMGLPFLRTSVDHGTAFDVAGKDVANERSMVEAILAAAKYYW